MNDKISPKVIGAILATGLMSFCGVIVETAMNITFPTLMKEFNVATNTVQWMTTLYLLVVASMVPLSATLKRRFKTRSLFICAISFFILGVILDGVAPAFWVMLLGRGIQGLGTGIALPLMFNIILEQVPASKIGMMMGVGTMITGVAPAIGPTFGGIVMSTLNWRYIFVFLLPVLIIALILGLTCIQQKAPTSKASVDGLSVGLIVITFCGLIFGISSWGSQPFISWSVAGALVIGVLALIGFTLRSLRIQQPIINLRLFGNRGFTTCVLAFVCLQISALGLSFLLPNYIQLVNGNTALVAGMLVLPASALGAIVGPLSGRLFDHIGAKLPLRLGGFFGLLGLLGMFLFGHQLSNPLVVLLYCFFMLGIGLSYGNLMTFGLGHLAPEASSDGNAIYNTLQQFAAALGTSLAAAIVAAGQAATKNLAAGTTNGTVTGFAVLAVLLFLELIFVVRVTRAK